MPGAGVLGYFLSVVGRDRAGLAFTVIGSAWDVGKLVEHVREGNTSDALYDSGHVLEDAALIASLAIPGAPLVVGGIDVAAHLIWDYGAHDQAVMADMHAAGGAYREHHYVATALDVGKGLGQLGFDLETKTPVGLLMTPLNPLPVMRFAAHFLSRL